MSDIDYILKKFGLKLKHSFWGREGFICHTDQGYFVVKKNNTSKQQIQFVYEMKQILIEKGIMEIDQFVLTEQALPYYIKEDIIYTVCPYINGDCIDFSSDQSTKMAVNKLAYIHKYTESISDFYIDKNMENSFEKKLMNLKHIKKYVGRKSNLSDIDVLFLKNYQYCLTTINETIGLMRRLESDYQYCLCHNNIKEENIKLYDAKVYYLNFESAYFGFYLWDLSEIIRRTMRWGEFSYESALELIQEYDKVYEIDKKNYELLKLMLAFPDKFYRLCMQYYNHKKIMTGTSIVRRFLGSIDVGIKQQSLIKKM